MIEKLFNHCVKCGKRIPWRKRAFYGNKYKPVICTDCYDKWMVEIYGSKQEYDRVMAQAKLGLVKDYGWPK